MTRGRYLRAKKNLCLSLWVFLIIFLIPKGHVEPRTLTCRSPTATAHGQPLNVRKRICNNMQKCRAVRGLPILNPFATHKQDPFHAQLSALAAGTSAESRVMTFMASFRGESHAPTKVTRPSERAVSKTLSTSAA